MLGQSYISKKEKLMPPCKAAKARLTLLFGGSSSGDMKRKPLLVYHSENPRALKNIAKGSPPLLWKSKPPNMGYTDHFPGVVFPLLYPRCRKMLLGEGCPIQHSFAAQQFYGLPPIHGQLSFQHQSSDLSASTTFFIQPMDQGVIVTFKKYCLHYSFC